MANHRVLVRQIFSRTCYLTLTPIWIVNVLISYFEWLFV